MPILVSFHALPGTLAEPDVAAEAPCVQHQLTVEAQLEEPAWAQGRIRFASPCGPLVASVQPVLFSATYSAEPGASAHPEAH